MLELAISHYGKGRRHNRDFIEKIFGLGGWHQHAAKGNWCGVFMHFLASRMGAPYPPDALVARRWLTVGKAVIDPKPGDIVVFWRVKKDSWQGHVGLFVGRDINNRIFVLGGNQGNRLTVCVSSMVTDRILGYRRL